MEININVLIGQLRQGGPFVSPSFTLYIRVGSVAGHLIAAYTAFGRVGF